MKFHVVQSMRAYQGLIKEHGNELEKLQQYELALSRQFKQQGSFNCDGVSWPIQSVAKLLVDDRYAGCDEINWRERLVCKKKKFNNRIRGAIHVFEQFCQPKSQDAIYLTEQHTVLYKWLKKKYTQVCGSEYLTDSNRFNLLKFKIRLFPDSLVHQDLTQLTYPNENFNFALSFDCFEHIPDYQLALSELFRVICNGGKLLFSVPFDCDSEVTLVRATAQKDGSVIHHVEPEYHGNPVSKQGSLSFYTFGWDLLDRLKEAGFKNTYAVVYWSKKYAYLGGPQLLICAEK